MIHIPIRSIIDPNRILVKILPNDSLLSLLSIIKENSTNSHIYLVNHNNEFCGSISQFDIINFITPYITNLSQNNFKKFCSTFFNKESQSFETSCISIQENETISEVLHLMISNKCSNIPVINCQKQIIYDIHIKDIISLIEKEYKKETV